MNDYAINIELNLKRNITFLTLFEALWSVGMGFAVFMVAVPSYLMSINAPKTLIGLIQTGFTTFAFVQIFSSYYCGGCCCRRKHVMSLFITAALFMLLPNIVLLYYQGTPPEFLSVWFFILAALGFIIFISLAQPIFIEILTDNMPMRKRGKLMKLRLLAVGFIGLTVSGIGVTLMNSMPYPKNYHLCFTLMSICYLLSTLCMFGIRDHVNPAHSVLVNKPLMSDFKFTLLKLINNPNYLIFIFFYACLVMASGILISYSIPFGKDVLKLNTNETVFLTKIFFITTILNGMFLGPLVDHFGNKLLAVIVATVLFTSFLVLLFSDSIILYYLAYIPQCVIVFSSPFLLTNMSVELFHDIRPSKLYTVGSLIPIPFILGAVTLCGWIIDYTGNYFTVFIIGITLTLISLMGFIFIVREPRNGKLLITQK